MDKNAENTFSAMAENLSINFLCNIMQSYPALDKVHNATVLASVSRNELIHRVQDRQLRFLGDMLRATKHMLSACQ